MSVGACISILGTFFLSGPFTQLKRMFEPTRLIASIMYVASIALTLFSGIYLHNPALAIGCIVAQYAALAFYSITYIPFAQQTLRALCASCC